MNQFILFVISLVRETPHYNLGGYNTNYDYTPHGVHSLKVVQHRASLVILPALSYLYIWV